MHSCGRTIRNARRASRREVLTSPSDEHVHALRGARERGAEDEHGERPKHHLAAAVCLHTSFKASAQKKKNRTSRGAPHLSKATTQRKKRSARDRIRARDPQELVRVQVAHDDRQRRRHRVLHIATSDTHCDTLRMRRLKTHRFEHAEERAGEETQEDDPEAGAFGRRGRR